MTSATAPTTSAATTKGKPSALRAGVAAVLAVVIPAAVVFATGLLPVETRQLALIGVACAVVVGLLCLFNKHRLLRSKSTDANQAMAGLGIQAALALDFFAMLVVAGGGMALLHLSGAKFNEVAAFGLAFATAVFLFQLVSTAMLVLGPKRTSDGAATGSPVS